MKNRKILAAIAAVSVLSLATGASVFAATASNEAKTKNEAVTTEAAEEADETEAAETETAETEGEAEEETSAEAENAEEETTAAGEADEKVKPPHAEKEKKEKAHKHEDFDVTDIFFELKDSVNVDSYDFVPDTIKENWDNIRKIKVHVDFNKDEADKPAGPAEHKEPKKPEDPAGKVKPLNHLDLDVTDIFYELKDSINVDNYDFIPDTIKENWDNISKIKVHVDFNKAEADKPVPPADREEGKKPEKPTPPAPKHEETEKPTAPTPPAPKHEETEKPTPPAPPAPKHEEAEKPERPTPPHKLHEAEETTDAEISE